MEVVDILREGVGVALRIGAPLLILSMLVGILVAIFQAVTQIHEQSLSFILKMIVVVAVLLVGGGWMLETLLDFSRYLPALQAVQTKYRDKIEILAGTWSIGHSSISLN